MVCDKKVSVCLRSVSRRNILCLIGYRKGDTVSIETRKYTNSFAVPNHVGGVHSCASLIRSKNKVGLVTGVLKKQGALWRW